MVGLKLYSKKVFEKKMSEIVEISTFEPKSAKITSLLKSENFQIFTRNCRNFQFSIQIERFSIPKIYAGSVSFSNIL